MFTVVYSSRIGLLKYQPRLSNFDILKRKNSKFDFDRKHSSSAATNRVLSNKKTEPKLDSGGDNIPLNGIEVSCILVTSSDPGTALSPEAELIACHDNAQQKGAAAVATIMWLKITTLMFHVLTMMLTS
ncbi:hypothetical protein RRG08_047689 [Elysia crispata]|uniref:Uncharacterized protein n=1 Tax=Elysia crispata TaxID=231223 RepID=A0AAE1BDV8_9GAST|nr:hypothetical protein RRG08_047689 [Elysia crispata]